MKKKIGIMGGTFDPPHIGHLAMAEQVRSAMALDEIWFIPTGGITYKERDKISTPKDRLAMTRLAVVGQPHFSVNPMEAESGKPSYSFETMERLRTEYPENEFVFIVGADSLDYMDAWREPERLFRCCTVAAVNRTGISREQMEAKKQMLTEKFDARIVLVPMPSVDVSSTGLRERVSRGETIQDFVQDGVWDYIQKHQLYQ
ncbi:MAG: nicotinate-nucleotide adenylyltransferase, partial [Clostridia bacterium]|nr:nicotinate-nucleotide adenylyltransferase [Clostridia bacterium]